MHYLRVVTLSALEESQHPVDCLLCDGGRDGFLGEGVGFNSRDSFTRAVFKMISLK